MTSSLDWAGLVPAVTAAVQAAAVMVQVYWDRRQRGSGTTEHDGCRHGHNKAPLPGTRVIRVQVSVVAPDSTPVAVVVLQGGGADGPGKMSLSAKGYHRW